MMVRLPPSNLNHQSKTNELDGIEVVTKLPANATQYNNTSILPNSIGPSMVPDLMTSRPDETSLS